MLDYRIPTFLTLCDVLNYRKTAELLNMTQPAVTQHIQHLERRYNCKLFLYDRKNLRMTEQAEILRRYAKSMMYQESKLIEQLHTESGIILQIGATKTIGEYVIADHVARFLEGGANRITVDVDNTEHLLRRIERGELDFALIEGFFDRREFCSQLYRKEPFVGLCSRRHRFAGQTIPLEEALKENLFLREEGSGTRTILEQLLAQRNMSVTEFPRITCISNFGLMSRLLEKSGGITFAYRAVQEENHSLAPFFVEGWEIWREFNYVFLDNSDAKRAVECFESFHS